MLSILIYPNITYPRDLERDSFVVVAREMVAGLQRRGFEAEWTALVPQFVESFDRLGIHQAPIQLPSHPNFMRTHFNSPAVRDALEWQARSYDVVFSHLPEHTAQLKNVMVNHTNESPEFVGYTHWTELPIVTNYRETMLHANLFGIASMRRCGVNTDAQRALIVAQARALCSEEVSAEVEDRLHVMHLGAEAPPAVEAKQWQMPTVVWNHRPAEYKSWPWVAAQIDAIWQTRKDFEVWVPLAGSASYPWMVTDSVDRPDYFGWLAGCRFGVGGAQKYAGWSVATTDGMSMGVPYLLHDELSYRELAADGAVYYTAESFAERFEGMLDGDVDREAAKARFDRYLSWDDRITPVEEMLVEAAAAGRAIGDTDGLARVLRAVDIAGTISKRSLLEQLGWGVQIPWSPYRNALRRRGYQLTATHISTPEAT